MVVLTVQRVIVIVLVVIIVISDCWKGFVGLLKLAAHLCAISLQMVSTSKWKGH